MNWGEYILTKVEFNDINQREEKEKIAKQITEKVKDGQVIGFGSGSTSYLTVIEIAKKIKEENINIIAIPTSLEIKMLCARLEIPTASIMEMKPDWSFDGADEVDNNNWMLKGRGGAMFKEKLNIANSPITYILIDKSKRVEKLGSKFKVPVECFPEAINYVKEELVKLGGKEIELRRAIGKDGPILTENNNVILDVKVEKITKELEKEIKAIPGVIESGLFIGYNVEIVSE